MRGREGLRAVLLVRNPFLHDARVLRAARTLSALGYRPLVVAARTAPEQPLAGELEGVSYVRVAPGGPIALADRRFRPGGSGGSPAAAPPAPTLALRAFRLLRTADYHRRALAVVLRERPALLHCNDYNTMWVGVAAKLLTGCALVYDAHELWPDRNGRWEWRPWLLACEALFTRVADEVVTASPGFSERMRRRYRIPYPAVVRNAPDASPSRTQPAPGDPVAVYVGNLLPGRGLEQAVEALRLVPGLRLRMIGPAPRPELVARLRERADALGVGERLEVVPPVAPSQVVPALAGASVGLNLFQPSCLSHELTLPNKLLEYVAAGVPVLTSDVPVAAAFVRELGAGVVVPAGDPEAIARGLRELLEPERAEATRRRLAAVAGTVVWSAESRVLSAVYAAAAR